MANNELQQWIIETLKDPQWGSHHKVKIWSDESKTYKEADWLYTYANRKAIIIEDKEENDSDIDFAVNQVNKRYLPLIKKQGYDDIITIAVKDTGSGKIIKVFRNETLIDNDLKSLNYYEQLLGAKKQIDISKEIYNATAKINQLLHDEFKISHLQDRMLFTGCILVASKQSSGKFENFDSVEEFKLFVSNKITSIETNKAMMKALKLNQLTNLFTSINIGASPTRAMIEEVCNICNDINVILKENPLTDIDIMNIFFTEFNRYRGKSENGQVFTPDHIAGLMADLLNISSNDKILDPCCGSGSLLLAASRLNNKNFDNIFGNDFDMNVLRLSYINMLLHNDGITNLVQMDARDTTERGAKADDITFPQWIRNNKISKVIANPPYEQTFAIDILENVLNNVEDGCKIVWLMPNGKMDKIKKSKRILNNNYLTDIILLGDIFPKTGTGDVSLFLFEKGTPQLDRKIRCWMLNDGFETVKNQGYQDVKGTWKKIKQDFLQKFAEGKCDKFADPKECLSYRKDIIVPLVETDDIKLAILQYKLFEQGTISTQNTVQSTLKLILDLVKDKKASAITSNVEEVTINQKDFVVKDVFKVNATQTNEIGKFQEGDIPFICASNINNGVQGFVTPNEKTEIESGNSISVSSLDGTSFYQKDSFVGRGHGSVSVLRHDRLNKFNALFICACIKKQSAGKFDYNHQLFLNNLKNLTIKLPVDSNGNIDWDYMESYVKKHY